MIPTRAQFDAVMVRRYGKMLAACGLDGTTADGTNVDLDDPLAHALRALNQPPSTLTPSTGDIAEIAAGQVDALWDCAGLFVIEASLLAFVQVDYSSGQDGRKLAQYRDSLIVLADRKRAQVRADHPSVNLGDAGARTP